MKRLWLVGLSMMLAVVVAMTAGISIVGAQDEGAVEAPKLREMLVNLGYEVKDLNSKVGEEKYEFKLTKNDLDVPIAAEVSKSKNFIWLTAFLGEYTRQTPEKLEKILKANGSIQPCMFYLTSKDKLMIALAVDNRTLTPAVLRRRIDKIATDVATNQEVWDLD